MTDQPIIDDPSLLLEFIADAKELLENMEPALLELEKTPESSDIINEIFRPLHTIKGTSGFLGLTKINTLSHRTEDILKEARDGRLRIDKNAINIMFESVDYLKRLIASLIKKEDEKIGKFMGEEAGAEKPDEAALDIEPVIKKIESVLGKGAAAPVIKISPELLKQFAVEAEEHFVAIEHGLLNLEKDPSDSEALNDVFRAIHTIKGNSDYVGLADIKDLSHKMESLLDNLRKGIKKITSDIIEALFDGVDGLKGLISNLTAAAAKSINTKSIIAKLEKLLGKPEEAEPPPPINVVEESKIDDMTKVFLDAARQHLDSISHCVFEIQKGGASTDVIDTLSRSAGTLKNSASYMNHDDIADTAKFIEDTAGAIKKLGFQKELIEVLDEKRKDLKNKIEGLRGKEGEPKRLGEILVDDGKISERDLEDILKKQKPVGELLVETGKVSPEDIKTALKKQEDQVVKKTEAEVQKIKEVKTIRIDEEKLDTFMNLVGELIVARNAFAHITRRLEIEYKLFNLAREMKDTSFMVNRISDDLNYNMMKMRMVPIKTVFQRFPRMVRDLCTKKGKKAELKIFGEETEIDKTVAEAISDPLVHLIRNSVDHGIEMPDVRVKAGKDETGSIVLKAGHEGNSVVIEILDDGGGINTERVKKKAIEKGIITTEAAEKFSKKDIIGFIFAPGFSTAEVVTDVSGRGVGMDVVKTNIQKIKGSIDIQSEVGTGTNIKLRLPLTLAVFEALMVGVGRERYAIPLDAVKETVMVASNVIERVKGREAITLRGDILGIVRLSDIMNVENKSNGNEVPVVVISAVGKQIGLMVDELFNQQDILIKPLDRYLSSIKGLAGATIMGDGRAVLVLDPAEIVGMVC